MQWKVRPFFLRGSKDPSKSNRVIAGCFVKQNLRALCWPLKTASESIRKMPGHGGSWWAGEVGEVEKKFSLQPLRGEDGLTSCWWYEGHDIMSYLVTTENWIIHVNRQDGTSIGDGCYFSTVCWLVWGRRGRWQCCFFIPGWQIHHGYT